MFQGIRGTTLLLAWVMAVGGGATQSSFKSMSAGSIGCLPDDIEISDLSSFWSTAGRTWVATCKGRRFVCTVAPAANGSAAQTDCAEELK